MDEKVLKIGSVIGIEFLKMITDNNLTVAEAMIALVNMSSATIVTFHHLGKTDMELKELVDIYCEGVGEVVSEMTKDEIPTDIVDKEAS